MIRAGIWIFPAALLASFGLAACLAVEPQAKPAAFQEIYDLLTAHLKGVSPAELDRKAVEGLVSALSPRVALESGDNALTNAGPASLVTRQTLFDGGVAYVRVGVVEQGLAQAVQAACRKLAGGTNALIGMVLDLRYAKGDNYRAAAETAELFVKKEQPLMDWGEGLVRSKANPDAFSFPVTVLMNRHTSGAAEALAAILRESSAALLLGTPSAGQAMREQDYPLSNGEHLRIATAPVLLADGTPLSASGGVRPDILIEVNPQQERAYFADAFKDFPATNIFAGTILENSPSNGTNPIRPIRLNEAELVRERKEGGELGLPVPPQPPEKPVVRDPVLARALDLLKGLSVVRQSHY